MVSEHENRPRDYVRNEMVNSVSLHLLIPVYTFTPFSEQHTLLFGGGASSRGKLSSLVLFFMFCMNSCPKSNSQALNLNCHLV